MCIFEKVYIWRNENGALQMAKDRYQEPNWIADRYMVERVRVKVYEDTNGLACFA